MGSETLILKIQAEALNVCDRVLVESMGFSRRLDLLVATNGVSVVDFTCL